MKFIVFLKYNYVFSSRVMTPASFGGERRRVSQLLFFLSNCITRPWRLGSLPVSCISSRSGLAFVFYFDCVFVTISLGLISRPCAFAFESFAGRWGLSDNSGVASRPFVEANFFFCRVLKLCSWSYLPMSAYWDCQAPSSISFAVSVEYIFFVGTLLLDYCP